MSKVVNSETQEQINKLYGNIRVRDQQIKAMQSMMADIVDQVRVAETKYYQEKSAHQQL